MTLASVPGYVAASLSPHVATGVDVPAKYAHLVDQSRGMVVVGTAGNYDSPDQGDVRTQVLETVFSAMS
jgi:hypothetical protein